MSSISHIRTVVFSMPQQRFAAMIGVSQGTVSKWENEVLEPSRDKLVRIREEALRRGLKWSDVWFFEPVPTLEHPSAPLVPNEVRSVAERAS